MASAIENDLEELLSCAICLGTLSEPKLLPCSHRFCKLCIVQEMDRSAAPKGSSVYFPCPLCKRPIKLGKGRNGGEWIVQFETDRLLKDIQDRLNQQRVHQTDACLSHRKQISIVCYSCRTSGCYTCAWQDHRHCSDVKNFHDEVRQMKEDLKHHLKESEACIKRIGPNVARWTMVLKSLKNQRYYSDKFIAKHLQHLQRESVSAVEDLLQEYECYIKRTSMSPEIEKEIRRLIDTFLVNINGEIEIFDIQCRLQSHNEIILWPQMQEASKRSESVQNFKMLISTVENIKEVLGLGMEDFVLRGKDLLTQRSNVLSKKYIDNLIQSMEAASLRAVQDSLVTRPEQIDLRNEKGERILKDLRGALQNAQSPMELVETCGRLCYPEGYHPKFVTDTVISPTSRKRQRKEVSRDADSPVVAFVLIRLRKVKSSLFNPGDYRWVQNVTYPRNDSKLRKRAYVSYGPCIRDKGQLADMIYVEDSANKRNGNLPRIKFCSFNSLRNKVNGEPFPSWIFNVTIPFPNPDVSTCHIFDNTDDFIKGRESERIVFDDSGNKNDMATVFLMGYEGMESTTCLNASEHKTTSSKVLLTIALIGIACVVLVFAYGFNVKLV